MLVDVIYIGARFSWNAISENIAHKMWLSRQRR